MSDGESEVRLEDEILEYEVSYGADCDDDERSERRGLVADVQFTLQGDGEAQHQGYVGPR